MSAADRVVYLYGVEVCGTGSPAEENRTMGCLKGKSKSADDEAKFKCKKCGAKVKKKGDICKPKKLKKTPPAA